MTPTDLQRIELAFPADVMVHVVDHGADAEAPEVQRVRQLLVGLIEETFVGLPERERRKLRTRLDRTLRAFLGPIVAVSSRVDIVGLIAWRVLAPVLDAEVLDAEVLVLPEGTPLSDALDVIRPALERAASDPVAAARAEVEWGAALQRIQAAGLYGGLKIGRKPVA